MSSSIELYNFRVVSQAINTPRKFRYEITQPEPPPEEANAVRSDPRPRQARPLVEEVNAVGSDPKPRQVNAVGSDPKPRQARPLVEKVNVMGSTTRPVSYTHLRAHET